MPGTEREEEGDGSRKLSFMPDDMCTTRNFNSFYPIIAIVCLDGEEVKSQPTEARKNETNDCLQGI